MSQDEFDPADPPTPAADNPLTEYRQPPQGIFVIAVLQFVIAALLAWVLLSFPGRETWSTGTWLLFAYPPVLFAVSGLGLALRRGWGWVLVCTVYFYLFFSVPVNLALWTLRRDVEFSVGAQLVIMITSILALAYLNRAELTRHIRFGSADGRLTQGRQLAPLVLGLGGGVVRLIVEWFGSG